VLHRVLQLGDQRIAHAQTRLRRRDAADHPRFDLVQACL
jgi:hypothetical protein